MQKADVKRGRYSLVFTDSSQKQFITITCDINTGEILMPQAKIKKLDLTLIDEYILTHFESEEQLRSYLKSLEYKIPDHYSPKIVYRSEHQIKFLEVIYQNQELYNLAFLYNKLKNKFRNSMARGELSNRELRKNISKYIQSEIVWKNFYNEFIQYIHNRHFYDYLIQNSILDNRAIQYIRDYLESEKMNQSDAYFSARYYLIDTFTAYKPIRGILICMQKYHQLSDNDIRTYVEKTKEQYSNSREVLSLLSSLQLSYLEKHECFHQMSQEEKENLVAGLLLPPWYECVDRILTESEIFYFESHSYFEQLSYYKKIEFVNSYFSQEKSNYVYQKKK